MIGPANYQTRIIVLGASGFIGRWVARYLSALGADLYLVVRHKPSAEKIFTRYNIRGTVIQLDLTRLDQLPGLFQKIKPSITFNLAGYGVDRAERDHKLAYQLNANLVKAVCQAVNRHGDQHWPGRHIVHVGSALEYGEIAGNLAEDSTPFPTTLYGKSKLAGTRALVDCSQMNNVNGITARLFTVYGPGEHRGRLLPALFETAKIGLPLELTAGSQKRDFTYVEDIVDGLLRLGLTYGKPGEIVNLVTGHLTSVRDFVTSAAAVLQIPADNLKFGAIPTRVEEMAHDPVSNIRLQQLTGWLPTVSITSGVRRTADFFDSSNQ
jgi:UDP-glucose 4-epimerase